MNDSFLTNSPIEVSYGNVSEGLIEISGGGVTYTPNANYNGTDSLAYVISQGGLSAENVASITITLLLMLQSSRAHQHLQFQKIKLMSQHLLHLMQMGMKSHSVNQAKIQIVLI